MAAPEGAPTAHPHAYVCAAEREYLIELDVRDVDVSRVVAAYTPDGSLAIRAPRLSRARRQPHFIHFGAEPC